MRACTPVCVRACVGRGFSAAIAHVACDKWRSTRHRRATTCHAACTVDAAAYGALGSSGAPAERHVASRVAGQPSHCVACCLLCSHGAPAERLVTDRSIGDCRASTGVVQHAACSVRRAAHRTPWRMQHCSVHVAESRHTCGPSFGADVAESRRSTAVLHHCTMHPSIRRHPAQQCAAHARMTDTHAAFSMPQCGCRSAPPTRPCDG